MRIVITSNYKLGDETGTAHVAETLAKHFSKKDSVTYICLGDKYHLKKVTNNLRILTILSLSIGNVSIPIITPNVVIKLFKFLNKNKPDVIHSQNSLFISNIAQIWANLNETPFVVTFHHIPTEALEHLFPKLPKNIISDLVQDLYKEFSLKTFLKNTDCVICLNESVKKSIMKVDKNVHVKVVNNGIDFTKLKLVSFKSKPEDLINFVFVGSYNERKNQEFLINVFSHLPKNYTLNMYGDKKSGKVYVKRIENLIDSLNLKNIKINDFNKNVIEMYSDMHFFISASLKEAQSLAIIEALASGIPVIGLKNETTSELINPSNGLVLAKNTTQKKFAIETINFIKKSNYKKISQNAKKGTEKFSIDKVALKIKKVYQSTACSNSKNSRRDISKYYQDIFKSIVIKK